MSALNYWNERENEKRRKISALEIKAEKAGKESKENNDRIAHMLSRLEKLEAESKEKDDRIAALEARVKQSLEIPRIHILSSKPSKSYDVGNFPEFIHDA